MPAIDLVVTDLDGTLWDHSVTVHEDAHAALATLARAGVPVLAATGRRKESALRGFAQAGLSFPAITVNGAYGFVPETSDSPEREFHRHPFDVDVALQALAIYRRFGHVPVAYNVDGTAHLSADATTSPKHAETLAGEAIHAEPEDAARLGVVVGFGLIGLDESAGLAELGDALRGLGLETDPYGELIYGGWSITTQPPGVSKWLGVERYCEFVELEQPRILALGDGGNDVELLRGADVSLGIDGGDPVALSASDRIIPRPEQGGWAAVLDYL